MIVRSRTPRHAQGLALEELDGEFVLYAADAERVTTLNATASLVWRLYDGTRSIDEVCALLCDAYPDDESVASQAALLTQELLRLGVLVDGA